jgi:hypothetical protein
MHRIRRSIPSSSLIKTFYQNQISQGTRLWQVAWLKHRSPSSLFHIIYIAVDEVDMRVGLDCSGVELSINIAHDEVDCRLTAFYYIILLLISLASTVQFVRRGAEESR